MSYPIDLILIRHGESEGNLAHQKSKLGDDSLWTPAFRARHTSKYRLTDLGVEQARAAGDWVKKNITTQFDRYYCSEYVRAMETAGHLQLEGAEWFSEFFLREQDMGVLSGQTEKQQTEEFASELERRSRDAFYYAAPGGESIANCALRVEAWLSHLRQSCSGFRVICVCHGNILKAVRIRIEKLRQKEWARLEEPENCEILHYTRRNPFTGHVGRNLHWFRSVCPWDPVRSENRSTWTQIERPVYTNQDLLNLGNEIPILVSRDKSEEVTIQHLVNQRNLSSL